MSRNLAKKIFIVDDNEMLTTALQDYLTRKSLNEVSVFSTGEECLEHLRENPDIVILDYNLNSVDERAADGAAILDTIKKLNKTIHVVMLSGQDDYGKALQTISKGADSYVVKDDEAFEKIAKLVAALS